VDEDANGLRISDFQQAYFFDPDFVEQRYQVPCLTDLFSMTDVVGVARFIEFPPFEPERLFTFVYRSNLIEVSATVGAFSLWNSKGDSFDPSQVRYRSAICEPRPGICPHQLRSWEGLQAASVHAGSCSTATLDGVSYRHRLANCEFRSDADWHNPQLPEHLPQLELIEAYLHLLRKLKLYPESRPWWKLW
jgi:hypothetical protein